MTSVIIAYFNGTGLDVQTSNKDKYFQSLDNATEKYDMDVEDYYNQMVRVEQLINDNCKGGVYGKKELQKVALKMGLKGYEQLNVIWMMNVRYLLKVGRIKDDNMFGFLIYDASNTETGEKLLHTLKQVGKDTREQSKVCLVCETPTKTLCQRCKKVYYCCRDCQVKDWKTHKKVCSA